MFSLLAGEPCGRGQVVPYYVHQMRPLMQYDFIPAVSAFLRARPDNVPIWKV